MVLPGVNQVLLIALTAWYVRLGITITYLALLILLLFVPSARQEHTPPLQVKLPVKLALVPPGALQVQRNVHLVKLVQREHLIAWSVQQLQRDSAQTVLLVLTLLQLTRARVPIVAMMSTPLKVPLVAKYVQPAI